MRIRVVFIPLLTALLAPTGVSQVIVSGGSGGNPSQAIPPVSTTPERQKCTVSGRVTNAQTGEALKKARLHLTRLASQGSSTGPMQMQGYAGTSEADGSFRFEAVEPGDYLLTGDRAGYLMTQYGSKGAMGRGTMIGLQPSQSLTELKLELIPQAVISGRVIDEDGDPAGGVSVQALGRFLGFRGKARFFPTSNAQTDETGDFRLANLRPGKYYLVADSRNNFMMPPGNEAPGSPGKPDLRQIRTFYPDALSRADATLLQVSAGQNLPGIDIHLHAVETFHIRGKVVGNLPEGNFPTWMLSLAPQGNDGLSFDFRYETQTVIINL